MNGCTLTARELVQRAMARGEIALLVPSAKTVQRWSARQRAKHSETCQRRWTPEARAAHGEKMRKRVWTPEAKALHAQRISEAFARRRERLNAEKLRAERLKKENSND